MIYALPFLNTINIVYILSSYFHIKKLRIPPKKDVSILMLVDPWTWCNICNCSEVSYYNPSHWCFYIYPTRHGSMCIWMLWIGIAPPVVTLTLETYTKKRSNKNTDTDVSTQVWSCIGDVYVCSRYCADIYLSSHKNIYRKHFL